MYRQVKNAPLLDGKYLPKNRGLPQSLTVGISRNLQRVSILRVTLNTLLAIIHCLATTFRCIISVVFYLQLKQGFF